MNGRSHAVTHQSVCTCDTAIPIGKPLPTLFQSCNIDGDFATTQDCVFSGPMNIPKKKVVAIKVGSNVITNKQGFPDEQIIANISSQIKVLKDEGYQVLLISSGAVAAGRSLYQFQKKADTVIQRQVLASIGQEIGRASCRER